MSRSLHPSNITFAEAETTKYECNVLPVYSEYTGPVSEGSQFWNAQKTRCSVDGQDQIMNYMRGRRLVGKEHHFGGDYKVGVFRRETVDGVQNTYREVGESVNIVNYGHERLPDENDPVEKLVDWMSVSNQIHGE
ncbi:hypothetical protein KL935_001832 [Ogataea polymorpha]|uniref:Uncharacterized protein n=1 Tax=Ogataea polymorpha TaxID=460523 RepID=A0A9P8PL04_9ASCO|nr:hypothetical protein KL937_001249 [Ogataea polymorpha]KAG7893918.1 hypothetical protein KL908_002195 [Ogataea polymorpha]KAG7901872.1 hypothetical protein KL935_001832 [Ogataea polymorpha]KAG7910907.1 hypothetical protein KL906_001287 [Ogataea polymorpha]KAG7918546.1 hypothetical protein KL927_002003 [Ogataea polymorpha]